MGWRDKTLKDVNNARPLSLSEWPKNICLTPKITPAKTVCEHIKGKNHYNFIAAEQITVKFGDLIWTTKRSSCSMLLYIHSNRSKLLSQTWKQLSAKQVHELSIGQKYSDQNCRTYVGHQCRALLICTLFPVKLNMEAAAILNFIDNTYICGIIWDVNSKFCMHILRSINGFCRWVYWYIWKDRKCNYHKYKYNSSSANCLKGFDNQK